MARTALTATLRRVHAAHAAAAATGLPAFEILASNGARRFARREFLAGAVGASALLAAACSSEPSKTVLRSAAAPRILILGGGLAGAVCAYRLWKAGVPSTLCDANSALGGRTWTLRNFFDEGQLVEHGGEFISSEHVALRRLALEMGLTLEDLRAAQPHGTEEIYYVRGQKYTLPEVVRDYAAVYPKLAADMRAAGFPTLYNRHTAAGVRLDRMSVRQWIERNVPGGLDSKLGWLLDLDATTENGGDSSAQSALELIFMLGYMPAKTGHDQFYLVGTDERYHVIGGNDQVVSRLAARVPASAIRASTVLEALRRRSDGTYVCSLSSQLRRFDFVADHVVIAIPFTTLRRVDLSQAGFQPLKQVAIDHLPMGTNTKLHLQFHDRLWYRLGYNGYTYSDTGFQQTWEASRAQPGRSGILTDYYGGAAGASFHAPSFGPATPDYATRFLSELEPIYPGVTQSWNGKAYMDFWTGDRWHHGSYSYLGVGQFTQFAGIEGTRQGNVHFCGEHTSIEFGGFMNGAVDTGERVAKEILADLGMQAQQAAR